MRAAINGVIKSKSVSALEKLEPIDESYTFCAHLKTNFGKFKKSMAENSYIPVGRIPLGGRSKIWVIPCG